MKGGSQTTKQQVPEYIEDAAKTNIARAEDISRIGYVPYYGPDVAAFTPMQQASFQNTADAASAFGMGAPAYQQDVMGGMPPASTYAGGVQGYSSAPMYDQSLSQLQYQRPDQYNAITSQFIDPGAPVPRIGSSYDRKGGGSELSQAPVNYATLKR